MRGLNYYERLSYRASGVYKGKNPHEILNGDIGFGWIEWLMIDWNKGYGGLAPPGGLKMSNEFEMAKKVA